MGRKPTKIAYDVRIQAICKGELRLIDFESKVKIVKVIWNMMKGCSKPLH